MGSPEVTPAVSRTVDRIREILIDEYDAPPDKITIKTRLWADGDFSVVGKSGVSGSEEYIEAVDGCVQEWRHVVRYHESEDAGLVYRRHVNVEGYEREIAAFDAREG